MSALGDLVGRKAFCTCGMDDNMHELTCSIVERELARRELAALRTGNATLAARVAELEALNHHLKHGDMDGHTCTLASCAIHYPKSQPVTLTPRQCVSGRECYRKGWDAAREAAAKLTINSRLAAKIRALTPPDDCGECNHLAPSLVDNCGSCKNFKRCESIFGCKPEATECDWIPSKFERA